MKSTVFNLLFYFILGYFQPSSVQAQELELTIIGNPETAPSELNLSQLRSVLRGEKLRWEDGSSVKIALMKTNTPIGTSTSEKIFNMSGNELNKYFLALVFQGKVKAPNFFNSTEELEKYVARTPGAIGVTHNATEDQTKIILIDGKRQF